MIVRESINFVRGKSSKSSLGVGRRVEIHRFFDELNISREDYTIDDDLNIHFKESLYLNGAQIEKLPDNLKVGWGLHLRGTQIAELPAGLEVEGSLYLTGSQIRELPPDLEVGGEIFKDF